MKEKDSGAIERKILIGAIVSTQYLRELKTFYQTRLIQSNISNKVMKWCFDYYDKYKMSPKRDIQNIFQKAVRDGKFRSDAEKEIIENVLALASEEFERENKFNVSYLLDQTEEYFKTRALRILSEDLEAEVSKGEIKEAEGILSKFKLEGRTAGGGVEPLKDKQAVQNAFEDQIEGIVQMPGVLGKMVNDQLGRDCFVALMGPEKRGKTWWLWEIAYWALRSHNHVAFFQAGDMTENQQIRRIFIHMTKRPHKLKYCQERYVPVADCLLNQIDDCTKKIRTGRRGCFEDLKESEIIKLAYDDFIDIVAKRSNRKYKPCSECLREKPFFKYGSIWFEKWDEVEPLDWRSAYRRGRQFKKRFGKILKLDTYFNNTLTVETIKTQLDIWEDRDNFIPDVIIIDYADLLIHKQSMEFRHKQNEIWKDLRGLSQQRHICLVTATQADAASYSKESLGLENYSEDKRKYAHVTAMFGLNQTIIEKQKGLMRISEMIAREDEFDIKKEVVVLQCLQRGQPYLDSFLKPRI